MFPSLDKADHEILSKLAQTHIEDESAAFVTLARASGKNPARDFRGATLRGFDLRGQDLRDVDLDGADLRCADLRDAQIRWRSSIVREGATLENGDIAPKDSVIAWTNRWTVLERAAKWRTILAEAEDLLSRESSTPGLKISSTIYYIEWYLEGLNRVGRAREVLSQSEYFLELVKRQEGSAHSAAWALRYYRACALRTLGDADSALAELATYREGAPSSDPDAARMRMLRALVLGDTSRFRDALAEINLLIAGDGRNNKTGKTVPRARAIRASILADMGLYGEAYREWTDLLKSFPHVENDNDKNELLWESKLAGVETSLGKYDAALSRFDTLIPKAIEKLGLRALETRVSIWYRFDVLMESGSSQNIPQILEELPTFLELERASPQEGLTLLDWIRLRPIYFSHMGRWDEAFQEFEKIYALCMECEAVDRPLCLKTRSSWLGALTAAGAANSDHLTELRHIVSRMAEIGEPSRVGLLRSRYRFARLAYVLGKREEAEAETMRTIAHFDPATDSAHRLLRSARSLLDMIRDRPKGGLPLW